MENGEDIATYGFSFDGFILSGKSEQIKKHKVRVWAQKNENNEIELEAFELNVVKKNELSLDLYIENE